MKKAAGIFLGSQTPCIAFGLPGTMIFIMVITALASITGCSKKAGPKEGKKVIGFSVVDMQPNFFQDMERGIRQACEHQMNNVFSHLVITPGDENFLAADQVVVAFGNGFRAYRRQVGARCGLSQAHRTCPVATDHIG